MFYIICSKFKAENLRLSTELCWLVKISSYTLDWKKKNQRNLKLSVLHHSLKEDLGNAIKHRAHQETEIQTDKKDRRIVIQDELQNILNLIRFGRSWTRIIHLFSIIFCFWIAVHFSWLTCVIALHLWWDNPKNSIWMSSGCKTIWTMSGKRFSSPCHQRMGVLTHSFVPCGWNLPATFYSKST